MTDFLFIFIFLCDHVTLTKNLRPKNNSRMHSRKIHSIIFCYKNVWLNLYSSTPLHAYTTHRIVCVSQKPPTISRTRDMPKKESEAVYGKHVTQGRFNLRYFPHRHCFPSPEEKYKMSFSVQTSSHISRTLFTRLSFIKIFL